MDVPRRAALPRYPPLSVPPTMRMELWTAKDLVQRGFSSCDAPNPHPRLTHQVHDYEKWTAKDVVQLDPSSEVALLLRFGPHRGEYMFHCHNLVHEDTEMMRSFHIKHTNVSRAAPTALPMQQHPALIQNLNAIYDL